MTIGPTFEKFYPQPHHYYILAQLGFAMQFFNDVFFVFFSANESAPGALHVDGRAGILQMCQK